MKNLSFSNAKTVHNFYTPIHSNLVEKEDEGKTFSLTHLDYFKWFDQFMSSLPKEAKILDAGTGRHATYLNYAYKQGYRNLYGIELNPESAEFVKGRYPHIKLRNESILETTASQDGPYRLVSCFGVAHHTLDTFGCMKKLTECLAKDGTFYFGVYAFQNSLSEVALRILRLFSFLPFSWLDKLWRGSIFWHTTVLDLIYVPIIHLFRTKDIEEYAERLGLKIEEHFPIQSDPFQKSWLGKLMTGDGFMRIYILTRKS